MRSSEHVDALPISQAATGRQTEPTSAEELRGVGAATAKILSERGWNVIITCSSSIEEANLVAKICSSDISEVFAMQADVAKEKDCIATID